MIKKRKKNIDLVYLTGKSKGKNIKTFSFCLILTFVPIQGIPADTMLILFFKALLNPNQYVYNKTGLDDTAQNGETAAASSPVTTAIHTQEPAAIKQAPSEKTQFILAPAT